MFNFLASPPPEQHCQILRSSFILFEEEKSISSNVRSGDWRLFYMECCLFWVFRCFLFEVPKVCRSNYHEKECQTRNRIHVKPEFDNVDGAMDGAVHPSQDGIDPRRPQEGCIDWVGAKQIEDYRVEQHGDFKEIFQIVRWVLDMRWRNVVQLVLAHGHFMFLDVTKKEGDAQGIHVEPYEDGQKCHGKEWTENILLVYRSWSHGFVPVVVSFFGQCVCSKAFLSFSQFRMWDRRFVSSLIRTEI